MNLTFFVFALGMTIVALSFVATPLLVATRKQNSGSATLSLVGAVAVFGLAIVLYGAVGRPDVADYNAPVHTANNNVRAMPTAREPGKAASVTDLLAGLEARLEESPNDGKGWLLLAQSYEHLGQIPEARSAYDRAVALGQSNTELEAKLVSESDVSDDSEEQEDEQQPDGGLEDLSRYCPCLTWQQRLIGFATSFALGCKNERCKNLLGQLFSRSFSLALTTALFCC